MVLLRRVIGDALRARRQAQHRTLREVSTAANVSLGYLSEIERGQKEPSSELLSAVCEALGAQLSELLRDVSHTVEHAERGAVAAGVGARLPGGDEPDADRAAARPEPVAAAAATRARNAGSRVVGRAGRSGTPVPAAAAARPVVITTVDGDVAVTVRQDGPLRATLRATRTDRSALTRV
jgi:transcriptional regulator with XRE-family HTH domain